VLSYLLTVAMAVELADRQRLLEEPDTRRRLGAILALLDRERLLLERLRAVPAPELYRSAVSPN
jgi:hypothetical protein